MLGAEASEGSSLSTTLTVPRNPHFPVRWMPTMPRVTRSMLGPGAEGQKHWDGPAFGSFSTPKVESGLLMKAGEDRTNTMGF